VNEAFDAAAYLTPHSDVVAHMVLNHQTRMVNLLTRLGWQSRIAAQDGAKTGALPPHVRDTVNELVDYMLFVDEAPLPAGTRGSSNFATAFPARGPRDSKGRSLRDLDLQTRLFRYPCSYMVYSPAFDALPARAKTAAYDRMSAVLSGRIAGEPYVRLSPGDRRAIVEILKATKPGLPASFGDTIK
jgi:hypothetical protein